MWSIVEPFLIRRIISFYTPKSNTYYRRKEKETFKKKEKTTDIWHCQ